MGIRYAADCPVCDKKLGVRDARKVAFGAATTMPCCGAPVPPKAAKAILGAYLSRMRKTHVAGPGRAAVPLPPCPRCKQELGARAWRNHLPTCGSPPYPCPHCKDLFPAGEIRVHVANCPQQQ